MTYSQKPNNAYWTTRTVGPFLRTIQRKVERWCDMQFGSENFCSNGIHYSFKNKRDAEMFALRWL